MKSKKQKTNKKYSPQLIMISSLISGLIGGTIVVTIFLGIITTNPTKTINILSKINNTELSNETNSNLKNVNTTKTGFLNLASNTQTEEDTLINMVEEVNPAVVSIVVTKDVPILEKYYESAPDPFGFDGFGGLGLNFQIPKYRENGTEKKEVGGGSGFIVSDDGLIATNKHVVSQEDVEYTVFTNEGKKYEATIVARDTKYDIAILKIIDTNLPYLNFGDSDTIKVGQTAISIGNALGEFRNTVSKGVISGLSRSITASTGFYGQSELLEGVIQTDAAINPGNSGGPLLNSKGEVIGVNVAMANGSENIGFALPSNLVEEIVESVKINGRIIRPFLGVRYLQITPELKTKNQLPVDYGVLIIRGEQVEDLAVVPSSPADKVDLQENDIILEIDNIKLDDTVLLSDIISDHKVGDKIKIKILHKGEEQEKTITLEETP